MLGSHFVAFSEVWRSFVPLATKRRLFAAVIGGLWTYAELAWPAHLSADSVLPARVNSYRALCCVRKKEEMSKVPESNFPKEVIAVEDTKCA